MTTRPLEIHSLTLTVGKKVLANPVNLVVEAGELHAIMGASGSGKSTLLWTILGLLTCSSGTITIAGEQISGANRLRAAAIRRHHTGIVYQQPNLIPELTTVENVAVPLMLTRDMGANQAHDRARDTLEAMGIDTSTPAMNLSGGEQQRVAIARATIARPTLLLADEPTAALDEGNGARVMTTMVEACRAQGASLVMVTHDSRVAARADHVWTLTSGGLVRE